MRSPIRLLCSGLLLLALGCASESPTTPVSVAGDEANFRLPGPTAHQLVVMSRNIYVGADVDAVIGALSSSDPSDDVPALLQAVATLQETDFTVRAEGLAREIARTRPDVVGLVEVSQIDIDLDLTPLGGPHILAHEDFLPEIRAALARHRLNYRVAASNRNFSVEPLAGVRLVDYDVTLIGPGVQLEAGVVAQNFATNVGPIAPGVSLTYGYVLTPVRVRGERYTVLMTHLQDDVGGTDLSLLRAAQMQEAVAALPPVHPSVIMGDLNDPAGSPMYQVAAAGGFSDAWAVLRPGQAGYTCCHSSSLTTSRVPDQRIDFVLARGFGHGGQPISGFVLRTGFLPWEMLTGPAHPIFVADHLGLVAWLTSRSH